MSPPGLRDRPDVVPAVRRRTAGRGAASLRGPSDHGAVEAGAVRRAAIGRERHAVDAPAWPSNVARGLAPATSQTISRASSPPVTRVLPSALKAALWIGAVVAPRRRPRPARARSTRRSEPSARARAASRPSRADRRSPAQPQAGTRRPGAACARRARPSRARSRPWSRAGRRRRRPPGGPAPCPATGVARPARGRCARPSARAAPAPARLPPRPTSRSPTRGRGSRARTRSHGTGAARVRAVMRDPVGGSARSSRSRRPSSSCPLAIASRVPSGLNASVRTGTSGPIRGLPPPGPRVEGQHVAAVVAGHEVRPSGATATASMRPPSPRSTRIARRAAQQRREQVAPRGRRVVERDGLPGEQQRAVQRVLGERLGAEPLRLRRSGPRCVALPRWSSATNPAITAATSSSDTPPRTSAAGAARARAAARPASRNARSVAFSCSSWVERHSSAPASRAPRYRPPESRRVRVPRMGGVADLVVQRAGPARPPPASRAAAAIRAAAPRARPRRRRRRSSPGGGSVSRATTSATSRPALDLQLRERDPAAHDRVALALAGEAQQHVASHAPAGWRRAATNASSASRATAPWTPPLRVYAASRRRRPSRWRQSSSSAVDSSGRAPGSPSTSASSASTSSGSTLQADPLRRPLDRAPQLVARHRADEHVVRAEQARQLGVRGAAAVEVGAHREHHDAAALRIARGAHERRDELAALLLVLAGGEQLLELVDREHAAPASGEAAAIARRSSRIGCSPGRISARGHPSLPGQHAARERGQQPGPHDRRLAAARRDRPREQRRTDEPRDQLGHELLAPEEVLGVVAVERRQALVRADHRRLGVLVAADEPPGALARRLQVDDVAGQLGLQRPGLAATGRRAARRRVDAARRLSAVPTRSPPRGRAARRRGSPPSSASTGIASASPPEAYKPAISRTASASSGSSAIGSRGSSRRAGGLLAGGERPGRAARRGRRELAQRGMHLGGRAVEVVEHQQRRPPCAVRTRDRGERRFGRSASRPRRAPPPPPGGRRPRSPRPPSSCPSRTRRRA